MKKIVLGLIAAFLFIGCSSKAVDENVKPALVVGQTLTLNLKDQNEKAVTVPATTTTVIFALSKDGAHTCNDYFETKEASYLADNNSVFVADVSSAPSLIRSMFIMPGLKEFKHTVLVLDDKEIAAPFRAKMDTEKIIIVSTNNNKITNVKTITTTEELIAEIEAK